jgi:3-hydroxyisobutyrate dehydrogenase
MSRVAVLGLGRMGAPMAARLVRAGHEVTVWNRSESGHDRLAAELAGAVSAGPAGGPSEGAGPGAPGGPANRSGTPVRADSPAAAVTGAEVVLTVLADAAVLDGVLFGVGGVTAGVRRDTVVCDLGTIGVEAAQRCAWRLAPLGVGFVDAPVSGSVASVRAGTVSVMAGGPQEHVGRIEPVVRAFAGAVRRVGGSGSGQAMKLAVNSVLHSFNAALSESLVLAERGGVPRATALDVLADSAVAAPFLLYKRAAFEDPGGAPVAFTVDLMRKDLELIRGFAAGRHSPVPVAEAVSAVCDSASAAGFGGDDMSAIAEHHRGRRD